MKKIWVIGIIALFIIFSFDSYSQRRWRSDLHGKGRPEKLEKYRKMRLIEVLKLNEEESVRFFAKQNAHEEKIREIMKSRNNALNEIKNIMEKDPDSKEIDKQFDTILAIDRDIFNERQNYQNELRKFLTPEQFGKYLVFEMEFGRQVREAIEELRKDPPRKYKFNE